MTTVALPGHAFAVAMASLPKVGPVRLRALLGAGSPVECWERLVAGDHPADPGRRWHRDACRSDVGALWCRHLEAEVTVLLPDDEAYPPALRADEEAPAVLFSLGDPLAGAALPRVAVVGTRSATRYGLSVAAQLGADLSAVGVSVVSGLALGIDGAAHEGACAAVAHHDAAPPLAVVAGGLDDPYPRRHAHLWRRVARAGAVMSECPVGRGNEQWRFPVRNRLLAALSHVVVVVECHARGGSLHTVAAADRRGVPVGAVPGSIRSPSSAGTNNLLADGAFPVRDLTDVLVALSLCGAPAVGGLSRRLQARAAGDPVSQSRDPAVGAAAATAASSRPAARSDGLGHLDEGDAGGGTAAGVLAELESEPASLEQLLRRSGLGLAELASALEELARRGRAEEASPGWWCRPG